MPKTESALTVLGVQDPELRSLALDSPTLDNWRFGYEALLDAKFAYGIIRAALDAAAYSVARAQTHTGERELDLPIGAAVGAFYETDGKPQISMVSAFARDRELDDRRAHAERRALDLAEESGLTSLGVKLTLGVTVEPCPSCLDEIDSADYISRAVYAVPRQSLEELGIVKRHGKKAPDIIQAARAEEGSHNFDLVLLPNRRILEACLEPLIPFARDPQTEEVVFTPEALGPTRLASYIWEVYPLSQPLPELNAMDALPTKAAAFEDLLNHFIANVAYIPED